MTDIDVVKDAKCEERDGKGSSGKRHIGFGDLKNLFPKQIFLSIADCFTGTEI